MYPIMNTALDVTSQLWYTFKYFIFQYNNFIGSAPKYIINATSFPDLHCRYSRLNSLSYFIWFSAIASQLVSLLPHLTFLALSPQSIQSDLLFLLSNTHMRAHTHMHSTHIQCIHSMLRIIKTNTKCTHHWRASLIDCVTVYQYLLALPGRRFLVSQPLEVMVGQKTCFCQWSISDVYHIHTKFKSSLCFATLFSICH